MMDLAEFVKKYKLYNKKPTKFRLSLIAYVKKNAGKRMVLR